MKRFFCLLAVLAAAGACNKADWTGNTPVGTPVSSLTVSSGPVTRTATDGSLQIRWTAGDQIAVYGNQLEEDEVATPFTITGEGGSSTATFAGNPVNCAEYGIAVYPYEESLDKYRKLQKTGVANTWVPKVQTYVPNSIPDRAMVMASRFDAKEGAMTFTALASVLDIPLYGDISVTGIKVEEYSDATTMGGKNLCGQTKITFDEAGVPSVTTSETSFVELVCETPVALNPTASGATSFKVVVSGTASFHHLRVTVSDNEGKWRTVKIGGTSELTTLTPGKVYSLPPMEVQRIPAEVIAGWKLASGWNNTEYNAGFTVGASDNLAMDAETGMAKPTTGSGYIMLKNNDQSWFRTTFSSGTPTGTNNLVFVPITQGDEIILAATDCPLQSGDQVQLQCCLWAYASKSNLAKANTSKAYELSYSLDGTAWNKLKDYSFSNNTNTAPTGVDGASADVSETVTLPRSTNRILFRFLSTTNEGTAGSEVNATGQTRLSAGSSGQLAILKL